jgi:hypothetical protein
MGAYNNAIVDCVAARFFVIGDDLFESGIFFLGKPLNPPYLRRFRRRIGDEGVRQSPGRDQTHGATKDRPPAQFAHLRFLHRPAE